MTKFVELKKNQNFFKKLRVGDILFFVKKFTYLFSLSLLILVYGCSGKTPEEALNETLKAPTVQYDAGKTASCFNNKSNCTELEQEAIEEELRGNYIVVRNVELSDIESDGDRYDATFCGKTGTLGCLSLMDRGRLLLRGIPPQCEYNTSLIITEKTKSLLSRLTKGSTWNVKGRVGYISTIGACNLRLRDAVLVK